LGAFSLKKIPPLQGWRSYRFTWGPSPLKKFPPSRDGPSPLKKFPLQGWRSYRFTWGPSPLKKFHPSRDGGPIDLLGGLLP